MRKLNKEQVLNILDSAVRKLSPVERCFDLVKEEVSRNEVGSACTVYLIRLSFLKGKREIDLAVVDYGGDVMLTLSLRDLSNGSEINLRDYFSQKNGEELGADFFKLKRCSDESELQSYVNSVFDGINNVCSADFEELVTGQKWIDLPFDWHGYK